MEAKLTAADMMKEGTFYFVPIRSDIQRDVNRLNGIIEHAQREFCEVFNITEDFFDIYPTTLEALKYWTFAVWQKSELLKKTQQGTAAKPNLVKGEPVYDLQKEIDCKNTAIKIMNKFTEKKKELYKQFLNH